MLSVWSRVQINEHENVSSIRICPTFREFDSSLIWNLIWQFWNSDKAHWVWRGVMCQNTSSISWSSGLTPQSLADGCQRLAGSRCLYNQRRTTVIVYSTTRCHIYIYLNLYCSESPKYIFFTLVSSQKFLSRYLSWISPLSEKSLLAQLFQSE